MHQRRPCCCSFCQPWSTSHQRPPCALFSVYRSCGVHRTSAGARGTCASCGVPRTSAGCDDPAPVVSQHVFFRRCRAVSFLLRRSTACLLRPKCFSQDEIHLLCCSSPIVFGHGGKPGLHVGRHAKLLFLVGDVHGRKQQSGRGEDVHRQEDAHCSALPLLRIGGNGPLSFSVSFEFPSRRLR